MISQKGEPAFQDIDSILAEKVIEHTERNIDNSESSGSRSEKKPRHTGRFWAVGILFLTFLFTVAAIKILMIVKYRK
ncbi:MAG: hypothetical protein GX556_11755 [Fibrobacter sp.]|nr:hypothetical protein [Fibrobacter sp.]